MPIFNNPPASTGKDAGQLYAWGGLNNNAGFLPDGASSTARKEPFELMPGTQWLSVAPSSIGGHHAAIRSDGALFTWGFNTSGQLGYLSQISPLGMVAQVYLPTQVGSSSWTAVSVGGAHTAAIRSDGALFAWGANGLGQLGDGSQTNRSSPVQIGTSSWTAVVCGPSATAAIRSDGGLFTWGSGDILGLNDNTARSSPVQVGTSSWTAVSSSFESSCMGAIRSDGGFFIWGSDVPGYVVPAEIHLRRRPGPQLGASSWTAVHGGSTIVAIRSDGALFAWGLGTSGQIGNSAILDAFSPIQIGSSSWTAVANGSSYCVAIRQDGGLFTWGGNSNGELGNGNTTPRSSPVQVGTSSWTAISTGTNHTLAIRSDGGLFAWGQNGAGVGRLGDGTTTSRSSPVQIGTSSWIAVACGDLNSAAIRSDGALFTWGSSTNGALGDAGASRSSPVQIGTSSWSFVGSSPGGSSFYAIRDNAEVLLMHFDEAGGSTNSIDSIKGKVFTAGSSATISTEHAKFGETSAKFNGSSSYFSTPDHPDFSLGSGDFTVEAWVRHIGAPGKNALIVDQLGSVSGLNRAWNFQFLNEADTTGNGLAFLWSTDGTNVNVYARDFTWSTDTWYHVAVCRSGSNLYLFVDGTQLGTTGTINDTINNSSKPFKIGGLDEASGYTINGYIDEVRIVKRALYTANFTPSATAFVVSNNLFGWGMNTSGELGVGDTSTRSSPTQVGTLGWRTVGPGTNHALGIRYDGVLFGWGQGGMGQVGDGNTNNVNSPIAISAATDWTAICGARSTSLAIRSGKLFIWGDNNNSLSGSKYGNFTSTGPRSPVQVGTSSWTSVGVSSSIVAAIRSDGALFTWGGNGSGQLGVNHSTFWSEPIQVGSSSWTAVSAHISGVAAIRTDGALFTWGSASQGALGDGSLSSKSSPVQIGAKTDWAKTAYGSAINMSIDSQGKLFAFGSDTSGLMGTGYDPNLAKIVRRVG